MRNIVVLSLMIYAAMINIIIAQIDYSISFDANKLRIEDVKTDSVFFSKIAYENDIIEGEEGLPGLPSRYLFFVIPNNTAELTVSINSIKKDTFLLKYDISPVLPRTKTSIRNEALLNSSIISSDIYPENPVTIIQDEFIDGYKRVITPKVSYLQYNQSEKELIFNSLIDFSINIDESKKLSSNLGKPIYPLVEPKDCVIDKIVIENRNDIQYITNNVSKNNLNNISLPVYEYIVVTSESLAPYFDRLISWKRIKGLNAGIITMQSILSDPNITGDEVSGIYDNAGKLRQYLTYAWSNGARYVLLAGQDSIVPIRYGSGSNFTNSSPPLEDIIPSDLYFSDLNGDWEYDSDTIFGEINSGAYGGDRVDYGPELYVGRLLCKNAQEVEYYTNKLLRYERNPGNGDFNYLRKAFYFQEDQMQELRQANTVGSLLYSILNDTTIYEELPYHSHPSPVFPHGADIITGMNGRYGFFSWFGHGAPDGITCSTGSTNLYPYRGITPVDSCKGRGLQAEIGNGLDCLTNTLYPAITYTVSCTPVPFDKYLFVNNPTPYSIGESFTVGGNYGGPAFLGNTRYGYVIASTDLFKKFISCLDSADYHLGIAEALSKFKNENMKHWLALTHNLIGCPELQLWSMIPAYTTVSTTYSNNSVSVSSSTPNSKIIINGLFAGNSYQENHIGDTCSFQNPPTNYIVSVCKHNYIPEIAPLYLQNEDVTGNHYIHASQVFIGNNVQSTKSNGDLVIKSGASVTIESSESVTMDAGFSVELGAEFEIKNTDL